MQIAQMAKILSSLQIMLKFYPNLTVLNIYHAKKEIHKKSFNIGKSKNPQRFSDFSFTGRFINPGMRMSNLTILFWNAIHPAA